MKKKMKRTIYGMLLRNANGKLSIRCLIWFFLLLFVYLPEYNQILLFPIFKLTVVQNNYNKQLQNKHKQTFKFKDIL